MYIEATILNGKISKDNLLLLRISMTPINTRIQFKCLQFSIRLAFVMTINKLQGQTTAIYKLDLNYPCFSREQSYIV